VTLLVLQLFEVTVISTTLGTPTVVPVMLKVVVALVAVFDSVKKAVEEDSGLAFTSMVAPVAGRLLVIFTVRVKLGPGAAGSTVPFAGLEVTVMRLSLQPPPPSSLLLHEGVVIITESIKTAKTILFINNKLVLADFRDTDEFFETFKNNI
jgi:hypothetical protein